MWYNFIYFYSRRLFFNFSQWSEVPVIGFFWIFWVSNGNPGNPVSLKKYLYHIADMSYIVILSYLYPSSTIGRLFKFIYSYLRTFLGYLDLKGICRREYVLCIVRVIIVFWVLICSLLRDKKLSIWFTLVYLILRTLLEFLLILIFR